ncbi:ATP-binding protein [Microbacterium terricola]|uniref:histidine kinase n=2 Tax=Microbacterium terricola TaxID=344163 RepID=A0ABM8E1B8_9MICO|nr:HAMP domain-containing sensor histidine kinase [Microbacterium terricola]UYK40658.1 HAMP domain-containing histidine kinase [Microbacterium terricola]BDV31609.1 two-component sensor histidine kinase [Microbacterium terricola]
MGVRASVSAIASLVVLFVLTLAAVALVSTQRAVLTDSVDEVLQRAAASIADSLDAGVRDTTLSGSGDEESFAYIVDASGEVVAATSGAPLSNVDAPPSTTTATIELGSSRARFRVRIEPHGDLTIVVGTPMDDVDESVGALTRSLLIAVPVATALLAVAIWFLVGRVLRPVERIRARVAEISASSLDQRVPEPATRDEIARLAQTMNSMLARLEATAALQRRFVSDASHELRSPLTRIRTALEVDLAHPTGADVGATHRGALADATQLQGLIDDLLLLARLDEAAIHSRRILVDLDDIVLAEVHGRGATEQTIDVSRVSAAQVLGDPGQLTRVVRNLLDNALRYGASGIEVELAEVGQDAVLRVSDDGPGVDPALRERIFERFARADDARAAGTGGTGLGLAIARELVDLHGGSLVLDVEHRGGASFVVRLPAAAPQ